MKNIWVLIFSLFLFIPCVSQDEDGEVLIRLGVLELEAGQVTPVQTGLMAKKLREALTHTGRYYVLSLDEMNDRIRTVDEKIPSECYTEKCVLDAGQLLAVSKVVVGEFDRDGKLTVLKLKMFDLESRDFEASAMVASECTQEQWNELAAAGIYRILGQELKKWFAFALRRQGGSQDNSV
jgi:hypothetical protein